MSIIDVEGAAARMRRGEFVIIVDDAERENEGDLAIAADMVTPEKVNFMAMHARGLICVPLLGERLDELGIPMMAQKNTSLLSTAFTESVDAKAGVTTGISAGDRSTTIRALVHPETRSGDLMRPGHMFPLRYREGGVLVRTGHTEAVIDLARAAGLYPAGVILRNHERRRHHGADAAAGKSCPPSGTSPSSPSRRSLSTVGSGRRWLSGAAWRTCQRGTGCFAPTATQAPLMPRSTWRS